MGGGGTSETLGKMIAPSWSTVTLKKEGVENVPGFKIEHLVSTDEKCWVGTGVAWGLYGLNAGCKPQYHGFRVGWGAQNQILRT